MKKLTWSLLLLLISLDLFAAHEFKNFKLTHNIQKSNMYTRDAEGLSPMMSKVKDFLKKYGNIALDKLIRDLIDYNHHFPLGKFNTPSVTWESGIGPELGVKIHRKIDPIVDSDKWQVYDQLTVSVGAKAFLKKLRDNGSILITDEKLDLFGGVVFTRTYTYTHVANSYKDGLKRKVDRLLLGFYHFMGLNFFEIGEGETLTKQDDISVGVELAANTPSYYFLSGYGEATVAFSRLNTVAYHKPLEMFRHSENESMRISRTVTKMIGTNIQVGLQADFYQLLRVTLLGMEYEVNYAKSQTTHMSLTDYDIIQVRINPKLKDAIKDLNMGSNPAKEPLFAKYITSSEEGNRLSEELNMFALVWGKHVGSSTEKLKFSTNEGDFYFYRHNDERASIKKSFWNFLFSSRNIGKFTRRVIKNMTLEYNTNSGDSKFSEVEIEDPAQISFRVSKEYQAKKDKKRYRKEALAVVEEFQDIDGGIIQGLDNGELKPPFAINLHAQIGKAGIEHIMTKAADDLRASFTMLCTGSYELGVKRLKRRQKKCVKLMAKLYVKSLREYADGTKIHLKSFKNFLQYVTKKMKSFQHLKHLFGADNVFLYGNLAAITDSNMPFKTYFSEGDFQGFGLIKDYVSKSRY